MFMGVPIVDKPHDPGDLFPDCPNGHAASYWPKVAEDKPRAGWCFACLRPVGMLNLGRVLFLNAKIAGFDEAEGTLVIRDRYSAIILHMLHGKGQGRAWLAEQAPKVRAALEAFGAPPLAPAPPLP